MSRRLLIVALIALGVPSRAPAPPPPPALLPDEFKQPVDGYNLGVPYQRWRWWVEAQKGAATEAVLAQPDVVEGEVPYGPPLLRFKKYNDFGHFMTGDIRTYCPAGQVGTGAGTCHYRFRGAFVSQDAAGFRENPVSRWTRASFDPVKLVPHLRASGLAPNSNWWGVDLSKMFAALPSAIPVLVDNATVERLDSIECPELGRRIAAMEGQTVNWRLDFVGVGNDVVLRPPRPHADRSVYTLSVRLPSGGFATIEGGGEELEAIAGPLLDTADRCRRDKAK